MSNSIDILLSTYDGEKHLGPQIDSIVRQVHTDWRLVIRDDGSTDDTKSVISNYERRYPERIVVLEDQLGNLGPARSYNQLAEFSTAPYIAFCDQDDIWLPDKLVKQASAIQQCEQDRGAGHPVLVHSDLRVVAHDLSEIAESYWRSRDIKPEDMNSLKYLLTKNYVTGCTSMVNRSLLELSLPFPEKIIMHDWWLALIAVTAGTVVSMTEKTVCYRQHSTNVVGSGKVGLERISRAIFTGGIYLKDYMRITRNQANELLKIGRLNEKDRAIVKEYVGMYNLSPIRKRVTLIRNGYFRYGLLKRILILIYM